MSNLKYILYLFFAVALIIACNKGDDEPEVTITIDETPYVLEYGSLPDPDLPADNPLTVQGVQLGRMLFYEKMLSKDLSQSCADCHRQLEDRPGSGLWQQCDMETGECNARLRRGTY